MERLLQGPIDPCLLGSHFYGGFGHEEEEDEAQFLMSSLEDKIPFLQMLQGAESPPFVSMKEPNFQTLLKLQNLRNPWNINAYVTETENQAQAFELESCVTQDFADLQSPVKSESLDLIQNPHSKSCIHGVISNRKRSKGSSSSSSFPWNLTQLSKSSPLVPKERKKRKRPRPVKNKEEVENQRMTHIAVERNRRRQMNDHLNSLRALMPPSYVQRGDQASIIGGAIDFVKELEQLLQTLEAEKRVRNKEAEAESEALMGISSNRLHALQQHCNKVERENAKCGEEEANATGKLEAADIEVTAVQNHVNLKIQCGRRPGQLLKAIIALEDLRLTVLHLNITSSGSTVLYSFNLKIEEDCKLGSADEVAATVNQIFNNSLIGN